MHTFHMDALDTKKVVLVLVFVVVSSLWMITMGDPRTSVAGFTCNTTSVGSGSVLAKNFVPAMDNLSSLVNQNGFGTTVVGEGLNAVYGLAQCFKDLNSIDCRLCFSEIRSILPKCYPKTGGRIFLDGCFGRYENFPFFNQTLDSSDSKVCFSNRSSSRPDKFREIVKEVIGNVSSEAQRSRGYAVGSVSSSNMTVFALAQCWENLDRDICNSCIQAAAASIISCSPAVEGRLLSAGCYIRYSTRKFWNWNQTASHSSGKNKTLWIILCSALGSLILLIGVVIWKTRRFIRKQSPKSLTELYGPELSIAISESNLNFRYQELRKATKNFDISNKLGQGSYGSVYKGILGDGREVAVKRLFLNTRQWVDQFLNEVDMINHVRHKNLVKLLGCSADGPESLLVYEYHPNKSLDQFIFDPDRAKHLDWQKRRDIIQGIAEGLSYLHEESEIRIIHRDIKASNILLDDKLKPKITDFGLARPFEEDQTHLSTGIAGTIGYMAPEYVVHGHLTEKADIYSFGVLTLEIVTGQRCSSGMGSEKGNFFLSNVWSNYKANTVHRIIDKSFYNEQVKDEILHVVNVGLLCTQATPNYRPTMTKVVELLRNSENHENLLPSDPPFLDVVAMEIEEQSECSRLLSMASAPNLTGPSQSQITRQSHSGASQTFSAKIGQKGQKWRFRELLPKSVPGRTFSTYAASRHPSTTSRPFRSNSGSRNTFGPLAREPRQFSAVLGLGLVQPNPSPLTSINRLVALVLSLLHFCMLLFTFLERRKKGGKLRRAKAPAASESESAVALDTPNPTRLVFFSLSFQI